MTFPSKDAALAALTSLDPQTRRLALLWVAEDGTRANACLDQLVTALDDADGEVRVAAVDALGSADPVLAEAAIAWAMESADYRVAVAARLLVQSTAKLRGPDSTVWRDPAIGLGE